MGVGAVVGVVFIAALAGGVATALGQRQPAAQHAVTALAAALGAVCASLLVEPTGLGGPRVDGLLLIPALVGAALVGGLAAAVAGGRLFVWDRPS